MLAKVIGTPATLENLAEECTELAHAALKCARILRGESPTPDKTLEEAQANLTEECSHVLIMLNEVIFETDMTDWERVQGCKRDTMERMVTRINTFEMEKNRERLEINFFRKKAPEEYADIYDDIYMDGLTKGYYEGFNKGAHSALVSLDEDNKHSGRYPWGEDWEKNPVGNDPYAVGYRRGKANGYVEGYHEGYGCAKHNHCMSVFDDDTPESCNACYDEAYEKGYDVGYNKGYDEGYDVGYIKGLRLGVGDMPPKPNLPLEYAEYGFPVKPSPVWCDSCKTSKVQCSDCYMDRDADGTWAPTHLVRGEA